MRNKSIALLLACTVFFSGVASASPTAEELFWEKPQTVHDFHKRSDLHNISATVLSLTEIEFIRMIDAVLGFPFHGKILPLDNLLDNAHLGYHKIPDVPYLTPFKNTEKILDALQIRQLSLSDLRVFFIVLGVIPGGRGSALAPMMQERVYRILVAGEDLIDDTDKIAMSPLSGTVSLIRRKPTRVETFGYSRYCVGYIRRGFSRLMNGFDRIVVRLSAGSVFFIEGAQNSLIRSKKMRKNGSFLIYARMPENVYETHRKFLHETEQIFYQEAPDHVLIAVAERKWKKAPEELKGYVIMRDEFDSFQAGPAISGR